MKKTLLNKRRKRGAGNEIKHEIPRRNVEKSASRLPLQSSVHGGKIGVNLLRKKQNKKPNLRIEKLEPKGEMWQRGIDFGN